MASNSKYSGSGARTGDSTSPTIAEKSTFRWLKLGVVAAISVIAGGAAVALFHRKTLNRIREAENQHPENHGIVSDDESVKEPRDD